MKRYLALLALLAAAAFAAGPRQAYAAADAVYDEMLIQDAALAYSTNPAANVAVLNELSMQGIISSATVATQTFDDGRASTASITFATQPFATDGANCLMQRQATTYITISTVGYSSSAVVGMTMTFTFNGTTASERYIAGPGTNGFTPVATASGTAAAIAALIDASANFAASSYMNATSSAGVVVCTATLYGTAPNSWSVSASSPTRMSTAAWTGGQFNHKLAFHTDIFEAGVDYTPVATASGTAKALSDAIVANPDFSGVLASSWSMVSTSSVGVVTATATAVGTAANSWTLSQSGPSGVMTLVTWANGSGTDISLSSDTITPGGQMAFTTGYPMHLELVSGTIPTGLTAGTTYYAIRSTGGGSFKLATTSTNSLAGTAVNITAVTGNGSFQLIPTAFAGTWGVKWQVSNDGTNWTDMSVSSITFATPWTATSQTWSGSIIARFIRAVVSAGTGGGINLKIVGIGKGDR